MAVFAGVFLAVWIALGYGFWVSVTPEVWAQKGAYAAFALAGWALYRRVLPVWFAPAQSSQAPFALAGAGFGVLAGFTLALPVLLLGQTGALSGTQASWPVVVLLGVLVPPLEEILYRDGLQRYLAGHSPPALAVAVSSAVFGLVHPFPASVYVAFCGLVFGVLYWRYGLISAILAHAVYNLSLLLAPWVFH